MKTKQEMRDELVRITNSPYFFKEHPHLTGVMMRITGASKTEITEKDKASMKQAFMEMGQYLYMFITESTEVRDYDEIQGKVKPELVGLMEFHLVPIEVKGVMLDAAVAYTHIDKVYDVFYSYSRVGIIDKVLADLT